MQKRTLALFLVGISAVAVLAGGCNDTPTQPSSTDSRFKQVELTGPVTIAPGELAQYALTVTPHLGGPRDISAAATWTSGIPSALKIDKGLATGLQAGEGAVTALFAGRSSTMTVVVTPRGTFRVKGSVSDAETSGRVAGAAVAARAPSGEVQRTITAGDGSFVLFGVAPESDLEVSHPTYLPTAQRLTMTEHATVGLQLTPTHAIPSLAGIYKLTIGSSGCPSQTGAVPLAGPLRQRSYDAEIRQTGKDLNVILSGPEFFVKGSGPSNHFRGRIDGQHVTFWLSGPEDHYYYYYLGPDIVERLDNGTYLIPSGFATLNFSGGDLRGTLFGAMRNRATPWSSTVVGQCSGVLPFVLVN